MSRILMSGGVLPSIAWIGLTMAVWAAWRQFCRRYPHPLLNPVIGSVATMVGLLLVTHQPSMAFRAGTQPLMWLLGPGVVAMGVPVWQRRDLISRNLPSLTAAVGTSLVFSIAASLWLPAVLGPDIARAMGVRSVTASVGIAIVNQVGMAADWAVVGTMVSALTGLAIGPILLAAFGWFGDRAETGIALGCTSHALGITRALEAGQTAGAFASVSMGLSAIAYGFVMPIVFLAIPG